MIWYKIGFWVGAFNLIFWTFTKEKKHFIIGLLCLIFSAIKILAEK